MMLRLVSFIIMISEGLKIGIETIPVGSSNIVKDCRNMVFLFTQISILMSLYYICRVPTKLVR